MHSHSSWWRYSYFTCQQLLTCPLEPNLLTRNHHARMAKQWGQLGPHENRSTRSMGIEAPLFCSPRNMACLRDEFWFTFSTWVCLKAESGRFDSHKRDAPFLMHFHARIFVHGVIDGFNYSLNHRQGCKLAFPRKRTASSTTILWLPYWYRNSLITHFRYAVMWIILNICVYLYIFVYTYTVCSTSSRMSPKIKH